MGKRPALQFYPGDWFRESGVRGLSCAARGAYLHLLLGLWDSPTPGQITADHDTLRRIAGADPAEWYRVWQELKESKVLDFEGCEGAEMTDTDKKMTIRSRRMIREETERKAHIDRQLRYKQKKQKQTEAQNDAKLTKNDIPSSSSSSSSSSLRKEKKEDIPKTSFRKYVNLKPDEYGKLVEQYGQENTGMMLDKLDAYKGSKGKTYKDDYRAILSWVVKEIMGKPAAYAVILAKVVDKHKPPSYAVAAVRTILEVFNRWQPTETGLGWWFYNLRDLTDKQVAEMRDAVCGRSGIEPDRALLKELRREMRRYV